MAISSSTIKKMRNSASASNNNKSSSSSSGGSSSNNYLGATMEKANGNASSSSGYTITSSKGMSIADGMKVGESYSASDGSTWTKQSDGSISVKTSDGKTYEKAYTPSITSQTIKGSNSALTEQMLSEYTQSDKSLQADKESNKALGKYEDLISQKDIISDDVWGTINSQFEVPSAVTEADAWLSQQLEKIQSGKTSYTDQLNAIMSQIMNREKFSYDVDTDPLFQQALASAMNSGKQAMQDTIGQASALTGGYGSTYATSAGNQAYNAFIEDAYDNLPQYYEMAMNAYQMEGDEMYRQYSMLSTEDAKEYDRNLAAYDATYQHRNQIYNEAYSQFRDAKTDAFATANLQLDEYGQRVDNAYNYYNAMSHEADKIYEREYTSWADSVNQALQYTQMLNSDYWNQSNQDFQATENQKQRDWQTTENQKDRDFTASENAKNRAASRSGGSGGGGNYKLTTTEVNAVKEAYFGAGGGEAGWNAAMNLLSAYGKAPQNDAQASIVKGVLVDSQSAYDQEIASDPTKLDWTSVEFTKTTDTWNGFLSISDWWDGHDPDDVYSVNGVEYTGDEIEKYMKDAGVPEGTRNNILGNLSDLDENGKYKYKK